MLILLLVLSMNLCDKFHRQSRDTHKVADKPLALRTQIVRPLVFVPHNSYYVS